MVIFLYELRKGNFLMMVLYDGPVICEIICKEWDAVLPTIGSKKLPDGKMFSKPLEDMYPFLTREEFLSKMIIKPLPEN
mgnify:CR=1 FL=1